MGVKRALEDEVESARFHDSGSSSTVGYNFQIDTSERNLPGEHIDEDLENGSQSSADDDDGTLSSLEKETSFVEKKEKSSWCCCLCVLETSL